MGLSIGLGSNAGTGAGTGGGSGAGGGVPFVQDIENMYWYCNAYINDKTITRFEGADFRYCSSISSFFENCTNLEYVGELKNTGNVTSSSYMFMSCSKLEEVPLFDTSNDTHMYRMFYGCEKIKTIPLYDTSKVTNFRDMFNSCYAIESIPSIDMSLGDNFQSMFECCYNLTTVPSFNIPNAQYIDSMFYSCSKLTSVIFVDTEKAKRMSWIFQYCSELKKVIGLSMESITSDTDSSSMFGSCSKLETAFIRNLGVSISFSDSPLLSKQSVIHIFNNAKTGVSGKTITLHADVYNQLTTDEVAIATEKGFTVASA